MHNGIKVGGRSYYGSGNLNLLVENRGVHEPQEERAFAELLPYIPAGGTKMLQPAPYWGFYSLWFYKAVPDARCFLVEPHDYNLKAGEANFQINGYRATFHQAYVGEREGTAEDTVPIISVDGFCRARGIDHLDILHSDIQGFEVDMLKGAAGMLGNKKKTDYVFISTHSNELHAECAPLAFGAHDYVVLASVDMDRSFSIDGLIVARRAEIPEPRGLEVSHR